MDIKSVYDKVKAGGFQNPVRPALESVLAKLPNMSLAELTAQAQAQAAISGVPVPSGPQLSTAFESLKKATENVNSMLDHSDILSGVNKASDMTITSIAKLGNAAKTIEQFKGCEFNQSVMGTLQNAANVINDSVKIITNIENFINDIPRSVYEFPAAIDAYALKIKNQVTSDIEAIAQAKVIVINNSIATALVELTENECMSEIFASVMTKPLKDEVTKVTDELKAVKLKSIRG